MEIGLFFGSFNPIHVGHLILAQSVLDQADLDEIWFVVSPQNPFKKKSTLLHEFDRIDMVREAIKDNSSFRASDVEFNLEKPSYTADTIAHLIDKFPQHEFSLIMGQDNLSSLHKWKNTEYLVTNHDILVYPRPEARPHKLEDASRVKLLNCPMLDISATYIRNCIREGRSIKYMVTEEVSALLKSRSYYKES